MQLKVAYNICPTLKVCKLCKKGYLQEFYGQNCILNSLNCLWMVRKYFFVKSKHSLFRKNYGSKYGPFGCFNFPVYWSIDLLSFYQRKMGQNHNFVSRPCRTFEIRDWRARICKIFEISWTIYSNSERSEQFLVTKCYFNLFLEVSHT